MKNLQSIAVVYAVFALVVSASSVAAHASSDTLAAQYRGYTQINRLVIERIAKKSGFSIGRYLNDNASEPYDGSLLTLLGTYVGADTDAKFRNGQPNSINLILWYMALSGLSEEVAAFCPALANGPLPAATANDGFLQLRPEFAAALKPMCAWPEAPARTDDALYGYWMALMSFDAPPEEFESWRDYFRNDPEFARAPAAKTIAAMTLAALYNPYFLLRN